MVILNLRMILVCPASTEHYNDTTAASYREVRDLAKEKPSMVVVQKTAAELVRDWNQGLEPGGKEF